MNENGEQELDGQNTEPELEPKQEESQSDAESISSLLDAIEVDPIQPMVELAESVVKPTPSMGEIAAARANKVMPNGKHIPLTRQQEINISKLSYKLYSENQEITPDAIREIWPTDPAIHYKAGDRPTLTALQRHLPTDRFRKDMLSLGIEYVYEESHINGLTSEQAAVVSYLTDMSSTKGFAGRLKDLGIKPAVWRSWMRQKPFAEAIANFSKLTLTDAIPMGEVQLASMAANGDLRAIKFLFEMEDRYNPQKQEQIDTQAMLAVMIDGVQEIFGDQPEKVRQFADFVALKAKAVRGVL